MEEMRKKLSQFTGTLPLFPKVRFEGEFEEEVVILILRQHPITQLPWIFNTVFLGVFVVVINLLFDRYLSPGQTIFFNSTAVIFLLSYVWINILRWIFNVGIVTNQRIIDMDFYNLLYKEVTGTKLEKVGEVTAKVGGFFGSVFQFGDVFVKTEGGNIQNIEFEDIPRPTQVSDLINKLIKQD